MASTTSIKINPLVLIGTLAAIIIAAMLYNKYGKKGSAANPAAPQAGDPQYGGGGGYSPAPSAPVPNDLGNLPSNPGPVTGATAGTVFSPGNWNLTPADPNLARTPAPPAPPVAYAPVVQITGSGITPIQAPVYAPVTAPVINTGVASPKTGFKLAL